MLLLLSLTVVSVDCFAPHRTPAIFRDTQDDGSINQLPIGRRKRNRSGSSLLQNRVLSIRSRSSRSSSNSNSKSDSSYELENAGKTNQEFHRSVSRNNRMSVLEGCIVLSPSQEAELRGLREKEASEPYNPSNFSEAHHVFKRSHNDAFCKLAQYCHQRRSRDDPINIFFLDGPDAGTATALVGAQFGVEQCHVANRHALSCEALRMWGIPPENVVHTSAKEALARNGVFGHICFGAFYLDGCGGHVPTIVDMLTAALAGRGPQQSPIAVGFSLLGGNRDVVDKEVSIIQSLVVLAQGLDMQVHHVLDNPSRYGVDPNLQKVEGGTMTSWFLLEPENSR